MNFILSLSRPYTLAHIKNGHSIRFVDRFRSRITVDANQCSINKKRGEKKERNVMAATEGKEELKRLERRIYAKGFISNSHSKHIDTYSHQHTHSNSSSSGNKMRENRLASEEKRCRKKWSTCMNVSGLWRDCKCASVKWICYAFSFRVTCLFDFSLFIESLNIEQSVKLQESICKK